MDLWAMVLYVHVSNRKLNLTKCACDIVNKTCLFKKQKDKYAYFMYVELRRSQGEVPGGGPC